MTFTPRPPMTDPAGDGGLEAGATAVATALHAREVQRSDTRLERGGHPLNNLAKSENHAGPHKFAEDDYENALNIAQDRLAEFERRHADGEHFWRFTGRTGYAVDGLLRQVEGCGFCGARRFGLAILPASSFRSDEGRRAA